MRRLALVVFALAALTWAVLIVRAIGAPEREPYRLTKARAAALVVAFVSGSLAFPRKRP